MIFCHGAQITRERKTKVSQIEREERDATKQPNNQKETTTTTTTTTTAAAAAAASNKQQQQTQTTNTRTRIASGVVK